MSPGLLFVLLLLPALAVQHLAHEYAHVATAKLYGIRVFKIQWLTYHGGTKVFFENEPDFSRPFASVDGKWAWIIASGYLITNAVGYLLASIFPLLDTGLTKAAVCVFGISFLFCDSMYFLLGSIFNFGDIVGLRGALRLTKSLSVIGSLLMFGFNLFLIVRLFR